jgi:DNA polymerase/3'-5' exonuclease PolX
MQKRGDNIRSRTYKRAQETILSIQQDITKPEDLTNKSGIGPTIMEKLKEYESTGTLALLEREKTNPENMLSDIYGVGPKKAKELVQQGITTIAQLREQQDKVLNDVQKNGLKYYEDILVKNEITPSDFTRRGYISNETNDNILLLSTVAAVIEEEVVIEEDG